MVIKFNPEGRVMMTIGRRPEAQGLRETPERGAPRPEPRPYNFGRPTDIGWDPQGNVFVTDGYINSRVVKYDKDGRYVGEVGTRGSEIGQLSNSHSMQVDAEGNVYVGATGEPPDSGLRQRPELQVRDRWRRRALGRLHQPRPAAVSLQLELQRHGNQAEAYANAGEIYKMELDGTIIGRFGKGGKRLGEFGSTHAMDCRNPDELLVAEITTFRVQKILLDQTSASQ